MEFLGWMFCGLVLGSVATFAVTRGIWPRFQPADSQEEIYPKLKAHFQPTPLNELVISERVYPYRVRVDLQRTIDGMFEGETRVIYFCGIRREYDHLPLSLAQCTSEKRHDPVIPIPPQYEEIDIGESDPVRVLKIGFWLLEKGGTRFAVLLSQVASYREVTGLKFEVARTNTIDGTRVTEEFFKRIEQSVLEGKTYRGKILSLEQSDHSYSGESNGITVHKLRFVEREQVILPESTLRLLERNTIDFIRMRQSLTKFGQSTRKGLLFYGPPGTGKTHTIHYLARALEGHTTLLISAEQVGLLTEYMTLARLLQPSIVVIEDVDLIARNREQMESPCEEVMLNKLLNEMDGLKEDADILFILTTNRPEALENALASRPGRIDQAIEFPVPDESGRQKLIRLYAQESSFAEPILAETVRRTEGVSAAFIKELVRRIIQFRIERNPESPVSSEDVDAALNEMLFKGGMLNTRILGAGNAAPR